MLFLRLLNIDALFILLLEFVHVCLLKVFFGYIFTASSRIKTPQIRIVHRVHRMLSLLWKPLARISFFSFSCCDQQESIQFSYNPYWRVRLSSRFFLSTITV